MGLRGKNYPPELHERAVRMVAEVRPDYPAEWQAICAVASRLGIRSAETLRRWVRQAEADDRSRPWVSRNDSGELKDEAPRPPKQTMSVEARPTKRSLTSTTPCRSLGRQGAEFPSVSDRSNQDEVEGGRRSRSAARTSAIIGGIAFVGAAAAFIAISLFPSRPPLLTPAGFSVALISNIKIQTASISIEHFSGAIDTIFIEASAAKPSCLCKLPRGFFIVQITGKVRVWHCPVSVTCKNDTRDLTITVPLVIDKSGNSRQFVIGIQDPGFAFTSNSETAIAALPHLKYVGPRGSSMTILTVYGITRANMYEWTIPPDLADPKTVVWTETVPATSIDSNSDAVEITGTDQGEVAGDQRDTFLSGALLGAAGAAAIVVVQEGLHAALDDRRRRRSSG